MEREELLRMTNAEFDDFITHEFPLLYADRKLPATVTCMGRGFEIGTGWQYLVYKLSKKLETIITKLMMPELCYSCDHEHRGRKCFNMMEFTDHTVMCECSNFDPTFPRAAQVKEKFAGLRVYMTEYTPEINAAIDEAEEESLKTCETCGEPGIVRSGGWALTLCDKHNEERNYGSAHLQPEVKKHEGV